jgi:hypothetical protein
MNVHERSCEILALSTAKSSATVSMLSGAIAGCLEAVAVWPTENIKTQLQLQGKVKPDKLKFTCFHSFA